MHNTVFITGTDTGVGKTVLTGLALHCLRSRGLHALATKPFCSGNREDVRRLQAIQDRSMSDEECNPFFFRAPIAPGVAGGRRGNAVPKALALAHLRRWGRRCDWLLIEGAGGLLAPLGRDCDALDLIRALRCPVWIAARNALGTLNHVLLTVGRLRQVDAGPLSVVLMDSGMRDASSSSNAAELAQRLGRVPVLRVPFLGPDPLKREALERSSKKIKKVLAPLFSFAIVSPSQPRAPRSLERVGKKR